MIFLIFSAFCLSPKTNQIKKVKRTRHFIPSHNKAKNRKIIFTIEKVVIP